MFVMPPINWDSYRAAFITTHYILLAITFFGTDPAFERLRDR
jgi:hypothetical protein